MKSIKKQLEQVKFKEAEIHKSAGVLDDFPVRKSIATREIVTGDHNAEGTKPEIVNVVYGTGSPPTASTTPIGTIYIQYTA